MRQIQRVQMSPRCDRFRMIWKSRDFKTFSVKLQFGLNKVPGNSSSRLKSNVVECFFSIKHDNI